MTAPVLGAGLLMIGHVALAWLLGWFVGYERYFRARAAGTQVYCLVCMATCALMQVAAYPQLWFGGGLTDVVANPIAMIGSVVTGIGFLGAGIIVKSGTSVRGLTTAASVWASSTIGILVGIDFIVLSIGLTLLFIACMLAVPALERRLPSRSAFVITLRYREGDTPQEDQVRGFLAEHDLLIAPDSLSVAFDGKAFELHLVIYANSLKSGRSVSRLSSDLLKIARVQSFTIEQSSRG